MSYLNLCILAAMVEEIMRYSLRNHREMPLDLCVSSKLSPAYDAAAVTTVLSISGSSPPNSSYRPSFQCAQITCITV